MGMTTMGVKLDDATRERIKTAATRIDRTPHWLIKQAILTISNGLRATKVCPSCPPCWQVPPMRAKTRRLLATRIISRSRSSRSRSCRSPSAAPPLPVRTAVLKRTPCQCCWSRLACLKPSPRRRTALAYQLADKLRNQKTASGRAGMVQSLLQEFSLSSRKAWR